MTSEQQHELTLGRTVLIGLALAAAALCFYAANSKEHPDETPAAPPSHVEPQQVRSELETEDHADDDGVTDSAQNSNSTKSWTSKETPNGPDKSFLNGLAWKDYRLGDYTFKAGIIYGKWIAASQLLKDNKVVLTEYTPPLEYVTVVDPKTGRDSGTNIVARDTNGDGVPEIIFKHQKLNDRNYHMYTVYALAADGPNLLWKSGGQLGDWLHEHAKASSDTSFVLKIEPEH